MVSNIVKQLDIHNIFSFIHTLYDQAGQCYIIVLMNPYNILTLTSLIIEGSAPFLISNSTTELYPSRDATCNGVSPRYKQYTTSN